MFLAWGTLPLALAGAAQGLEYDVVYLGSRVGSITVRSAETAEGLVVSAEARSARWYRPVYNLHDRIQTVWNATGTVRSEASLREGRYHHDLQQTFGVGGVVVNNRQRDGRGWRRWTDRLEPAPGAFDPVGAVLAVARQVQTQEETTVPVLSGRDVRALRAVRTHTHTETHPVLGTVELLEVDLTTVHREEISRPGSFVVWVSKDPHPTLVRGVLRTPVGRVRVELVAQEVPDG